MDGNVTRTVVSEGREITYCLERKAVKNLNLRIRKDGHVFVSANTSIPAKEIDVFVLSKASYILGAIDKFNELSRYSPHPKCYVSGETFIFWEEEYDCKYRKQKEKALFRMAFIFILR